MGGGEEEQGEEGDKEDETRALEMSYRDQLYCAAVELLQAT